MKGITREQAKPIHMPDGRIVSPIWTSHKTHRDYHKYLESVAYADGWNSAMDYVFGVNPNKPNTKLVKCTEEEA